MILVTVYAISMKKASLVKSSISLVSFAIVIGYFDVISVIVDKESRIGRNQMLFGFLCILGAFISYAVNYVRFVIKPRPSQQITSERWYTVSPGAVFGIIAGCILGLFFLVVSLVPQYGVIVSCVICTLGVLTVIDLPGAML